MGVDPGGTTGLVMIDAAADAITIEATAHLTSHPAIAWVWGHLTDDRPDAVVAERFTISVRTLKGTREGPLEALYTLGALRFACQVEKVPLALQTPAAAKNAFTDARLKDLGLYQCVSGPHERDALRHALLFAMTSHGWRGEIG